MSTPISPSAASQPPPPSNSDSSLLPLNEEGEGPPQSPPRPPLPTNAVAKSGAPVVRPGAKKREDLAEVAPQPKRPKASAATRSSFASGVSEERYQGALARTLSKAAQAERREVRERLRRDTRRLGTFRRGLYGQGADRDAAVQWDGGSEFEQLNSLKRRIKEQHQEVDKLQQWIKTKKSKKNGEQNRTAEELEEDLWEQRELCVSKSEALKRAEADLKERENRLNLERREHLRRYRATEAEDSKDFGSFQTLKKQYQLLRLLKRNSSVEVYQAYDVTKLEDCLVKIHNLQDSDSKESRSDSTSESRLDAIRMECEGVKCLKTGSGFAALLNHFMLENGSKYVTVWEFCEGDSFESFCLRNAPITEKDARGMLLQLLSALRNAHKAGLTLSTLELKPSRIIFRGGELKIMSIGLPRLRSSSRRLSLTRTRSTLEVPGDSVGMESQEGDDDIDSSSSVIRTAGAILYELLFNKPLRKQSSGEESIAAELPDNPRINQECKECLCRMIDRESRFTLQDASADPFFAPKKGR